MTRVSRHENRIVGALENHGSQIIPDITVRINCNNDEKRFERLVAHRKRQSGFQMQHSLSPCSPDCELMTQTGITGITVFLYRQSPHSPAPDSDS